jgi:hypothetical protein
MNGYSDLVVYLVYLLFFGALARMVWLGWKL